MSKKWSKDIESQDEALVVEVRKRVNKKLIAVMACSLAVVLAGGGVGAYFIDKAQKERAQQLAEQQAFEEMKNATRGGWELTAPAYMGGTLANNAYYAGPGLLYNLDNLKAAKMQTVSNTTRTQFDAYLTKLAANDYELVARNEVGNSVFVSYQKGNEILYTYHANALQRTQVIVDCVSVAETAFEYMYTPQDGDTSAFYQYAIMNDPLGQSGNKNVSAGKYADNGMFYIIKLADNGLILIDGGSGAQASDRATAAMVDFLYEITGADKQAGEKIRVACAIITHAHGDHYGFLRDIVSGYSETVDIERFAYNFPQFAASSSSKQSVQTLCQLFQDNYPNALFMKIHTGQSISLANATVDVITTHEDLANPVSGYTTIGDFNYSSSMFKITLNGKSLFLMADWGGTDNENALKAGAEVVLGMYEENSAYPFLQSDFVQVGHHGLNEFSPILNAVQAPIAFIPQADSDWYGYIDYTDEVTGVYANRASIYVNAVEDAIAAGATQVYFQSRTTYGFVIDNQGVATLVQEAIRGTDEEYDTMMERFNPFIMPSKTE